MTVLALLAVLATTAYMSHPPTETHGPIVQAGVVNRVTGSLPNERIKPMTGTQRRRLRWEQKQKQKQQQQTQSQSQVVDARLSVSNTQENKVEAVPDHSKQDDMCTNTMEATSSTTRNAANAAPAKRVDHDGEHEQVARGHGRAASEQAQAVEQQERPAESDVASDEEYKSVEHVNHVCAKSFVQDCENASEVVKSVTRADGGQQCGTKTMSTVGFQEPMSEYVRACDEFGIDLKASKAESVKMVTVAVQQEEIVPQSGHGNKIPVRAEAPTVDKPQLAAPPKSAARTRGLRSIVGKAIKTMFGRDKSKQDKVGADHGQDEISEPSIRLGSRRRHGCGASRCARCARRSGSIPRRPQPRPSPRFADHAVARCRRPRGRPTFGWFQRHQGCCLSSAKSVTAKGVRPVLVLGRHTRHCSGHICQNPQDWQRAGHVPPSLGQWCQRRGPGLGRQV
ncbi:hypothetical protein BCR44DRAFT_1439219 [Catenaria anguillulae PL171]|uniref:Uncharacterized protein n=1 Tax=Catenaria anguillulae PL171 TaxID=765915 RepID=A0A1Y2HGF3_9FUNG|nr:hypothetical protein BCR44DRAFT_1439219 [Catenaria anguillulae PL171]